jgi:hypothetical protein
MISLGSSVACSRDGNLVSCSTFRDTQHRNLAAYNMSDNDKLASSAERGRNTNDSSTKADMTLAQASAHAQRIATSVLNGPNDSATSPARKNSNTNHSSIKAAATLDGDAPATDQTQQLQVHANAQDESLLFHLPPELRLAIYTNVVYNKYSLPQFEWDDEHNSPKLNLKCAQPRAPSNELLRTCRSVYDESKGVFIKAQREFWSDTTFTLNLPDSPRHNSFGYLECMLDEQARHMTRVNIRIEGLSPFTVHLRSGPEVDSSVRAPACTHRSWFPEPLNFVESVVAVEQIVGRLRYGGIIDILWRGVRGPGSPYMRMCVEHRTEPVVLSVRDLSRTRLMAVVAWTCDAPKARTTG